MDMDEVQFHQIRSCPAIENDDCTQPLASKIVFEWVKDGSVAERTVHLILSDVDDQIELMNITNIKYKSEIVSLMHGKYSGHLVMGNDIHPVKDVTISQDTTLVDIELKNNVDEALSLVVAKNEHSQHQSNGGMRDISASTNNGVLVEYDLNKRAALAKKMASCEREDFEVELKTLSCLVQLNTASFEYFREDIIAFVNNCAKYRVIRHDPVKDKSGCLTAEIVAVGSSYSTTDKLFTINIYQTTSRVMVNGSKFQLFVEKDLPSLLQKLKNRRNTIHDVNQQFRESIPIAMGLLEQSVDLKENINSNSVDEDDKSSSISNRRNRKKKSFEDYEITKAPKRSKKSGPITEKSTEKSRKKEHSIVECVEENDWEAQPKYWEVYGQGTWDRERIKSCNKRKGCLTECGGNNSSQMIQCDGCGHWCHNRCIAEDIDVTEDYICCNCKTRVIDENVQLAAAMVNTSIEPCVDSGTVGDKVKQKHCEMDEKEMENGERVTDQREEILTKAETEGSLPTSISESTLKEDSKTLSKKINDNILEQQINDTIINEQMAREFVIKQSKNTSFTEQFKPVSIPVTDNLISTTAQTCQITAALDIDQTHEQSVTMAGNGDSPVVNCNMSACALFGSGDSDESLTLGMQFKDKKFLIKVNNILKGKNSQQDILYGMIMKMKEKLFTLQSENQQGVVKKSEVLKIQEVTQRLEKSEEKVKDLKEKLKKVVLENSELKKDRKTINDEKTAAKAEVKETKKSLSLKEKAIIGLHEKLEVARVVENRLNSKIETLENITLAEGDMNVIDATSIDRNAEKIEKIRKMEDETKRKDEKIEELSGKVNKLNIELTRMKDMVAEKNLYIKNVDSMYEEIIDKKNKTIECFNRVADADDEMAKGFKRLLMKTLAEKEVQNVKALYMEMKCSNVSTQTAQTNGCSEEKNTCVNASTQASSGRELITNDGLPDLEEINDSSTSVELSKIGKSGEQKYSNIAQPKNQDCGLVTLRVVNLPTDMDIPAVKNFLNIEDSQTEKNCDVVIDRINDQRVVVKIVISAKLAPGILKFDQTMLHRRKIKVFKVEKCRLGPECARKVCRFGHEERVKEQRRQIEGQSSRQISSDRNNVPAAKNNDAAKNTSKEPTLWKIRNLPEKMNTVGVIRFITNLGVVVEEARSLYRVLSIKNHETVKGSKVEAVVSMTDEMGKRLLSHNGMEVENINIDIRRTKLCRHGNKCLNMGRNCAFYHERIDGSARESPADFAGSKAGQSVTLCWFQSSCPFGKKCKFLHPDTSPSSSFQNHSVDAANNSMLLVKN